MTFIAGLAITTLVVGIFWLVSEIWFLKRELEDVTDSFENYKKHIVGRKESKCNIFGSYMFSDLTSTTLVNDMEDMQKQMLKIEEYLGIKRLQKEEKIDKYVKVKK